MGRLLPDGYRQKLTHSSRWNQRDVKGGFQVQQSFVPVLRVKSLALYAFQRDTLLVGRNWPLSRNTVQSRRPFAHAQFKVTTG
jgi:hypothetical protein